MATNFFTFILMAVATPIIFTELLLFACWRNFGDGRFYTFYSCALRIAAYSPCLVSGGHGHGILPIPAGSALVLNFFRGGGTVVWLYGIPEVFVGVACYFVSFAIRTNSISSREETRLPRARSEARRPAR